MFEITTATFDEMEFILSLAKAEGWNPGLEDARAFYSADPKAFFIGKIDGKKIGCISAVAYNGFAFLGFYIVLPEYRRQGYGHKLWHHALDYAGNRLTGLDGVVAQQSNYAKSGFKYAYTHKRFVGQPLERFPSSLTEHIPFETLKEYDRSVFGYDRSAFLKPWLRAICLGKMEQGLLVGMGVMRRCEKGYKIGPLFADHLEVAKEIYQGLCSKASDGPIYIDVPEINKEAMELVEFFNLKSASFETGRMYNQNPPKQPLHKVFGVTTLELG
jgi:GNAT superfamily N-acetyltransferase